MARVSKKPIPEKVFKRIFQLFFEIVARSQSNEAFSGILDDVLSPTEKVMVAKRIGIIYLLIKNVNKEIIAKTLRVSSSTVAVYSYYFHDKNTHIVKLIKKLLTKEKIADFMDDAFTDLFVHPGLYIGHWQQYWDHKRRKGERKILS